MSSIRFALRQWARTPAFSVAIVATLAIGIGASVLMFSVVERVLLEPLPYPEPDRIVRVQQINDRFVRISSMSDPNFLDLKAQSRAFSAFAQTGSTIESVAGGSEPARARVATVSREFFDVLGVEPALGRGFAPSELEGEGAAPAVIVGHRYWQRHLEGTPELSGRRLRIGDRVHAVVGVMPSGFDYPDGAEIWTPRELWPVLESRTAHNLQAVARLASGVTLTQARADVSAVARRLKAQHGDDTLMEDAAVVPLKQHLVSSVRPALLVLSVAVALLFLIACANVVSMLLARTSTRERELAVRVALGAGRARLARQFLTETGVLCVASGALGLGLARVGLDLLVALNPEALPRAESIDLDWTAAAFALGLSVLAAVALSVGLAGRAFGDDVVRSANRRSADRRGAWFRDALVAAQVAMTLVLIVCAALLGRSYLAIADVDPGFRTQGAVLMNVALAFPRTADAAPPLARFHAELLDRVRALPGVAAAGGITAPPLMGGAGDGLFIEQRSRDEITSFAEWDDLAQNQERTGYAEFRVASEGYFATMGIPLLRGRMFEPSDFPESTHVALISRSLAERRWPGEDPLGKLVQFGNMDGDLTPFTIVGIVGDVREYGLDAEPRPTFYGYYRQRPRTIGSFWIAIDTRDGAGVMPAAREIVLGMNPDAPPEFRTVEEIYSGSIAQRRFNLVLLAAFGVAALLLALAGVYGALAFNVGQRTLEIGVRLALGAQQQAVVLMVLRRSLALTGIGLLAGLAAAFGASKLIASLLYGIAPHDLMTYAAAAVLLVLAAGAASWLPARRASSVDPLIALRQE